MSELPELSEIVNKILDHNIDHNTMSPILAKWLILDGMVDLYKLCTLVSYFIKKYGSAISKQFDELETILPRIGIYEYKVPLSYTEYIETCDSFYDDNLVEFYKDKYWKLSETSLTKLVMVYGEYLGFRDNILENSLEEVFNSYKITTIEQIGFLVNISEDFGKLPDNYIENYNYIRMFILAKQLGYNENRILEKFGIKKETYDVVTTQDYYDYTRERDNKSMYEIYLSEKKDRDFNVAAGSFISAIYTSMNDTGDVNAVISEELIHSIVNMPGFKKYQ